MEAEQTSATATPNNDVITNYDVSAVEAELWEPVSSRYPTALRITVGLYAAVFLFGPWLLVLTAPEFPIPLVAFENAVAAVVFGFLAFVWVPRRARYTKYLLRERDVNLQKGFWWHMSTSVAINRLQHLEVTQGPIERALNISKLTVFTAGGARSDMVIPGLDIDVARQLKSHLLKQVGNEELDDELL